MGVGDQHVQGVGKGEVMSDLIRSEESKYSIYLWYSSMLITHNK